MGEIRPVAEVDWDSFVDKSENGTVFCKTQWIKLFEEPKLYGYYKGDNLIGGTCDTGLKPITPFQGILVNPPEGMKYHNVISLHNEVSEALMDVLPDQFYNHYTFTDMRPFQWANWGIKVKYTYVVHPDWDNLEKDTRNAIRQSGIEVIRSDDIEMFDSLYEYTFSHKGLQRTAGTELLLGVYNSLNAELYMASDYSAGVMLINDNKRYYYILGASTSQNTTCSVLWEAIKDKHEIDFVGCNDKNIAHYKKGFGGKLVPYFGLVRL